MMWLVFERFYPRPAVDQMVRVFLRSLRLMAALISESSIGADAETIVLIRKQRDQVYRCFGEVNAQADAVPFETGPERAGHMAARDRIRRWQSWLRSFYIMEIPLLQFRLLGDPSRMSEAFRHIEAQFIEDCSRSFRRIADILENQLDNKDFRPPTHDSLLKQLTVEMSQEQTPLSPQEEGLLRITRLLSSLVDKLEEEATSGPIFSSE